MRQLQGMFFTSVYSVLSNLSFSELAKQFVSQQTEQLAFFRVLLRLRTFIMGGIRMKKRIISLVLMICLLFTLMPTVVKADVIPGTLDSLRYELYGEEDSPYGIRYGACAVITGCDEAASGKIVIPDKIQGYAVKLIEDNSFRNCHNITEVEIPNNVFYIGDSAFEGCERLSRVRIPNKITKIDLNSFFGTGIWNNEANWLDGVLYIDHVLLAAVREQL